MTVCLLTDFKVLKILTFMSDIYIARTEWMGSGDRLTDLQLHVMARLSRGRDWDHEKVWYGTTTLCTTLLLVGQDFCALSVQLSLAQQH